MAIETKQLLNLSRIYREKISVDESIGTLTNADKKANTPAWQNRNKLDTKGNPLYKMAPHLNIKASYNPNGEVVNEKKAAKDYDGDGKVESGKDEYFGSKDKAIKKAMGKSPVAIEKKDRKDDKLFGAPKVKKESFSNWRQDLQEVPDYDQIPISAKDRNKKIEEKNVKNKIEINPDMKEGYGGKKKKKHDCASKVKHEQFGVGHCISEAHDLDENGNVAHYDVEFEEYIVKNCPVEELEILEGHMHEHVILEKEVDVKDTRRTVDAIRAYDRSKDASRDATYDTDHGKKKKGDKEKAYAKKERGEIDKDDPNWKKRKYHTGMHGESYEVKKKKEVMSALKKRKNLKDKVKEKIAADIVKRKGDTSKSDDRYAYESYGGEPIQGEGTKGKNKKELIALKKAAQTGKGKYVAKADKVES